MTEHTPSTHDVGPMTEQDCVMPYHDNQPVVRRPRQFADHQHRARTRSRLAILAVLLLSGTAALTVDAQPAAASTAECDASKTWRLHDADGDPYGGKTPFDYTITTPAYHASSGSYTPNCWMAKGASGGEVLTLQKTINRCYGPVGIVQPGGVVLGLKVTEDGIYGSQTAGALRAIQSYHHISADGVYGPQTASHIRHRGTELAGGDWPGPLCHALS